MYPDILRELKQAVPEATLRVLEGGEVARLELTTLDGPVILYGYTDWRLDKRPYRVWAGITMAFFDGSSYQVPFYTPSAKRKNRQVISQMTNYIRIKERKPYR